MRLDLDEVRRRHNISDVLKTDKKTLVCPLPMHQHVNNTPSFSIYYEGGIQHFKCHGSCNTRGTVIDLVGYLRIPNFDPTNKAHIARAADILEDKFEPTVTVFLKRTQLVGSEWLDYLPAGREAIDYCEQRGISQDTMCRFNIGQNGTSISIPTFEEKSLVGIKFRAWEGNLRYWSLKGSRMGVFNHDDVAYQPGTVLISKGEIAAMLMWQEGFRACAMTGGEGGFRKDWFNVFALSDNIVVGDNDEVGRELGHRRAALLHARLVFPPARYKDWDAWLLADRANCLKMTKGWVDG